MFLQRLSILAQWHFPVDKSSSRKCSTRSERREREAGCCNSVPFPASTLNYARGLLQPSKSEGWKSLKATLGPSVLSLRGTTKGLTMILRLSHILPGCLTSVFWMFEASKPVWGWKITAILFWQHLDWFHTDAYDDMRYGTVENDFHYVFSLSFSRTHTRTHARTYTHWVLDF